MHTKIFDFKRTLRRILGVGIINPPAILLAKLLLKPSSRSRLPVVQETVAFRLPEQRGQVVFSNSLRCDVAKEIYWNDGQLEKQQDVYALDAALKLSEGAGTFIDVGAYTGLFAIAVAGMHPKINSHAYEIVGENFMILWENILRNDLAARVKPNLIGLGAEDGQMNTPFAMGFGSLASSISLNDKFSEGVSVPIRTLDELHLNDDAPVVIKIDVEGFEMEVFDGGQELIQRHKPDIICEVLRRARRVDEMMEMLTKQGYRWLHITEHGFQPKSIIVADKLQRDWLFTTKTDAELAQFGLKVKAELS